MTGFIEQFGIIEDPRVDRTKKHKLIDILFITLAAILCGCDEWEEIESYGHKKEPWLRKYLELPNGIPSHDTFNRTISAIDPEVLQQCFISWVQTVVSLNEGDVVSIDGKRLCNSGKDSKEAIVHMVSAWSDANNMVLGCCKVDDKSNEITAIPRLLDILDLSGCIISIDAMGCQTDIAAKMIEKQAHYLLAVKDNQQRLSDDIQEAFSHHPQSDIESDVVVELSHGRIERRSCRIITDMDWVCKTNDWKGLKTMIEITAERTDKKTCQYQREQRYYISDLLQDAASFNQMVRKHWSIENKQHWVLDVAFNEDSSRKRAGNAAENFAMLNRIALNLVKADTTTKASVKRKRKMAGWDDQYLEHLLCHLKN